MQAERIKSLCKANKILWTRHCLTRMFQRDICQAQVKAVLMEGECGVRRDRRGAVYHFRLPA